MMWGSQPRACPSLSALFLLFLIPSLVMLSPSSSEKPAQPPPLPRSPNKGRSQGVLQWTVGHIMGKKSAPEQKAMVLGKDYSKTLQHFKQPPLLPNELLVLLLKKYPRSGSSRGRQAYLFTSRSMPITRNMT